MVRLWSDYGLSLALAAFFTVYLAAVVGGASLLMLVLLTLIQAT